jgi:hypothetical protein
VSAFFAPGCARLLEPPSDHEAVGKFGFERQLILDVRYKLFPLSIHLILRVEQRLALLVTWPFHPDLTVHLHLEVVLGRRLMPFDSDPCGFGH